MRSTRPPLARRLVLVAAAVAIGFGAFSAGAFAASLTIQSSQEMGRGSTEPGLAITWWSQAAVSLDKIPSPAPTSASAAQATPTLLTGANASYALGSATANDTAVRWDFDLKSPPVLIEFELKFTLQNLTGTTASTVTVYLETPATSPSGTVTISLYFDNGPGVTGFRVASQLSQQCVAFGSCP